MMNEKTLQNISSNLEELSREELEYLVLSLRNELIKLTDNRNKVSEEEQICHEQIRKLNLLSQERELTFDEAKRFEIFNKNLSLIRGATVETPKKKKSDKSYSTAQLLEIASES